MVVVLRTTLMTMLLLLDLGRLSRLIALPPIPGVRVYLIYMIATRIYIRLMLKGLVLYFLIIPMTPMMLGHRLPITRLAETQDRSSTSLLPHPVGPYPASVRLWTRTNWIG